MKYVIRSRLDGTYLAVRPMSGRFLYWAPSEVEAFPYEHQEEAEADAEYAWMGHWKTIVEIVALAATRRS